MVTNRHAYLILAYICPRLLQVMIDMIDDERNDIYVHVDAKVDITNFAGIHSQKSKIIYTDRGKHYWGNDSFVKNEFFLLETALKNGPYMYYHILSETTLPLKSQDYIHHMLDEEYRGHEFIGYAPIQDINERVRYCYLFDKHFKDNTWGGVFLKTIMRKSIGVQKRLGVWRNKDVVFYKGSGWGSITEDLCKFLIANKKRIFKLYKRTFCPDESFIQTMIYDTSFYEKVHDKEDEYKSCMQLIDWERNPKSSSPHTWTREDWDELTQSDRLFARKFSEDDMDFIYRLKSYVLNS